MIELWQILVEITNLGLDNHRYNFVAKFSQLHFEATVESSLGDVLVTSWRCVFRRETLQVEPHRRHWTKINAQIYSIYARQTRDDISVYRVNDLYSGVS